jgi:hypothetical protein
MDSSPDRIKSETMNLVFVHELVRSFFMKGINESYIGLSGNNSVSMAWNVLMKKVKYWIMLKMVFSFTLYLYVCV